MTAPVIDTIRPGVQFTPPAAASFRRLEADLGRPVDVNSTYRDWNLQLRMYHDWRAYVDGTGPKPAHSRAIYPSLSRHTSGLALDSDDWSTPGFVALAAEHGWIRTAAGDPTEQHHFEYQWWRDQHRDDPIPAKTPLEDEMILIESLPKRGRALVGPGYYREVADGEQLKAASRLASKKLKGNARQFDVWKALALQGVTPSTTITLTDKQLEQITAAASAGGAEAIAGLAFVVKATPA